MRAYGGVWAGQLRWGRLTHARVLGILANPAYAGTYVYGRYRSRRVVTPDGDGAHQACRAAPAPQWPVVIHDHHPGYISWDDYLANEARLAANRTNAGARPPREGQPCARASSAAAPAASRCRPATTATARLLRLLGLPRRPEATAACRSISAVTVDDAVAERLLDALDPEQIALALAAADEVADRRARRSRAAELAVERARYEADRAERAFHACEPENRLVARTLESRWEPSWPPWPRPTGR